jgi:hypothetical protein
MSATHVKAFRLFDLAQSGNNFRLLDWEKDHLDRCEECREVLAVFARQVRHNKPPSFKNGDTSPENGLYANLCCGWEVYIPKGRVFPDCRRHKNLSTVWKQIVDESRKRSA